MWDNYKHFILSVTGQRGSHKATSARWRSVGEPQ